jgi:tripartite-type tricarboxylate transporter receptor subunit TctC
MVTRRGAIAAIATMTGSSLSGSGLLATGSAPAFGQSPFYAGKTLNIIVGSTTGGYYDTAGRTIARHLPRFIPGRPSIVVQNQPGAGGLAIANKLANTLDRDGTSIVVMSRALPQLAFLGDPNANFDPLKLNWLGSLSSYKDDGYLMVVNESFPAQSLADLAKLGRPAVLGGTRAGSTNITFALIAREMLGINVDVVRGFPGANEIWLAMERGEVDGQIVDISAIMVGRPHLWAEKKLRPLIAFGRTERLPDFPDLPIARERVKNPDDFALLDFAELPFFMALPVVAPPGIPADRVAILRTAFMDMAQDETFRAEMLKAGIMTSPIDGFAVTRLLEKAAQAQEPIRQRFARLLSDK